MHVLMKATLLYEKVPVQARYKPRTTGFELTLVPATLYINPFAKEPILSPTDLETKLDELTQLCEASAFQSNQQLQAQTTNASARNGRSLLERNVAVKSKVEGMILRLKSLEQD